MNTGEKIKQHRLIKKISPKDIASILDMDVSNYYRIERDEVKPDIENLIKIADYLQVDPRELLCEDKVIINSSLHDNSQYGVLYNSTINQDSKLTQLFEDKIKLMEEKMQLIINENIRLKEDNELLKNKIR